MAWLVCRTRAKCGEAVGAASTLSQMGNPFAARQRFHELFLSYFDRRPLLSCYSLRYINDGDVNKKAARTKKTSSVYSRLFWCVGHLPDTAKNDVIECHTRMCHWQNMGKTWAKHGISGKSIASHSDYSGKPHWSDDPPPINPSCMACVRPCQDHLFLHASDSRGEIARTYLSQHQCDPLVHFMTTVITLYGWAPEREREREMYIYIYTYVIICMYTCINTYTYTMHVYNIQCVFHYICLFVYIYYVCARRVSAGHSWITENVIKGSDFGAHLPIRLALEVLKAPSVIPGCKNTSHFLLMMMMMMMMISMMI